LLIFAKWNHATMLNVINTILACIFWILCAIGLFLAAVDSTVCNNLTSPRPFDSFMQGFKDISGKATVTEFIVPQLFKARKDCFSGLPTALANVSLTYGLEFGAATDAQKTALYALYNTSALLEIIASPIQTGIFDSKYTANMLDFATSLANLRVRDGPTGSTPLTAAADYFIGVQYYHLQHVASMQMFYKDPADDYNSTVNSIINFWTNNTFTYTALALMAQSNNTNLNNAAFAEYMRIVARGYTENITAQIDDLQASFLAKQTLLRNAIDTTLQAVNAVQPKVAQLWLKYNQTLGVAEDLKSAARRDLVCVSFS
jgi:hypothetical protein